VTAVMKPSSLTGRQPRSHAPSVAQLWRVLPEVGQTYLEAQSLTSSSEGMSYGGIRTLAGRRRVAHLRSQ